MTTRGRNRFLQPPRSRSVHPSVESPAPELHLHERDIVACKANFQSIRLTDGGLRAAGHLLKIVSGFGRRYNYVDDILAKGGTLFQRDFEDLLDNDERDGTLSEQDAIAGSQALGSTIDMLLRGVRLATHDPHLNRLALKAYGVRKPGLGPHRDSGFPTDDTTRVASVGLDGINKFSVWAIPDAAVVDNDQSINDIFNPDDRPLRISLNGQERSLRPVATELQGPGDIVYINEFDGVWDSPEYGPMKIWHSAIRANPTETRLGAIIRTNSSTL